MSSLNAAVFICLMHDLERLLGLRCSGTIQRVGSTDPSCAQDTCGCKSRPLVPGQEAKSGPKLHALTEGGLGWGDGGDGD